MSGKDYSDEEIGTLVEGFISDVESGAGQR